MSFLSSAYAGLKTIKSDASDAFFDSTNIPKIKIEITGTNLSTLRRDNRKYVRAKVTEGKTVYENVAIHLKGAAGSFRGIDDRPALTLNFDKFEDDQKFHGIDKLHLNNSVQDPSYMTELICGELFRAAGVPAPRTTHARVELNGRSLGLYVLKEGFDKTFLRRYFNDPKGNLYDGGFIREITDNLQKTSGDEPNYADLRRLAAAAQEPDVQKRWTGLEQYLDVDCMLSFMALEVMTWHWDGYTLHRNNYRVYHDPTSNRIYFFPHGMDQMFWVADGPVIANTWESLIGTAIITTPEGRARYRQKVTTLLTNIFTTEKIIGRINELQKKIRPALAAINEGDARNHDGAVQNLRNQVTARVAGIQRILQQPEPKPLHFDSTGITTLANWRMQNLQGVGALDKTSLDGIEALHIRTRQRANPSWRTRVLLDPGQYRFEAKIKTAGVNPFRDEKGEGAGLRISGQPRPNRVSGDTDWKLVGFNFTVPGGQQEIELVCELTAAKGDAWFDLNSLKLLRKP
ncbi:MAG TPA: CotH kinase family protein [Candidatus Binatia bacterium]|nr:CotH kinase family protein [Candidatus Binatia bacterium]